MPYDLINMTAGNETGLLTLVQGVNTVLMDGWLGIIFLIGIVFVMLTSFYFTTQDFGRSLAATSFIAFTLALTMAALDLLPPLALLLTLIIAGIGVATSWSRT